MTKGQREAQACFAAARQGLREAEDAFARYMATPPPRDKREYDRMRKAISHAELKLLDLSEECALM